MSNEVLPPVQDITALWRMYDSVEVQGLISLGFASVCCLLLYSRRIKLPPESRIVINQEVAENSDLDKLMKMPEEEIEVRERSVTTSVAW